MSEPFVAPSQSAYLYNNEGQCTGHMMLGGATLVIKTHGRSYKFEMHTYFGPCPLTPVTEEPTDKDHGKKFWDAFERWELGGRLVDGNVAFLSTDRSNS